MGCEISHVSDRGGLERYLLRGICFATMGHSDSDSKHCPHTSVFIFLEALRIEIRPV